MKMELTWHLLKQYIQYSTVFYHYDEDLKRANFYSDNDNDIIAYLFDEWKKVVKNTTVNNE